MKYVKEDKALQHFVRRIREELGNHLKQFTLFGSRARGQDVPGSDYDCLLVVDEVSKTVKDTIDEVAGETLYHYNALFSAFIITEEKHNTRSYSPLLMNIDKEGVAL